MTASKSGVNALLFSEQLDNAAWVIFSATCSITANAVANPIDGAVTADKIVESNTNNVHLIRQSPNASVINHKIYFSGYFKAAERTWVAVYIDGGARGAFFNLGAGTIGTLSSNVTATIAAAGGGWYRCEVSGTNAAGSDGTQCSIYMATADAVSSYQGDGASGIYAWGLQCAYDPQAIYVQTTTSAIFGRRFMATTQNLCWPSEDFSSSRWQVNTGVTKTAGSVDISPPPELPTAAIGKFVYDGSGSAGTFKFFQNVLNAGADESASRLIKRLGGIWLATASGTVTLTLTANGSLGDGSVGGSGTSETCVITTTWTMFGVINWGWASAGLVQVALYHPAGVNSAFTVYATGAHTAQVDYRKPGYVKTIGAAVNSGAPRRAA